MNVYHSIINNFIVLFSFINFVDSLYVFKAPDVFYSQYCILGTVGTGTYGCNTAVPQTGIIRTALALSQFAKSSQRYIAFKATVASTSDLSNFQITLNVNGDSLNWFFTVRISFFLVIIKTQSTNLYIDVVPFQWTTGSIFDNNNNFQRQQNLNKDVTTMTIFSSGTTGLSIIPFLTYYAMYPVKGQWWQGFYSANKWDNLEYTLTASISGSNAVINLKVQSQGRVSYLGGFGLIYNSNLITSMNSSGTHINFLHTTYSMGNTFNLSSSASAYGPKFNSKCLLGPYRIKHHGMNNFQYLFWSSVGGTYQTYKQSKGSSLQTQGNFFCFGNSTQCAQVTPYLDILDGICYTGNLCPLPIFTGWNYTQQCPPCNQLICQNCTLGSRSGCTLCTNNSHLNGSVCQCDLGYYQVNMSISSSATGLWNNNSISLMNCLINCTYFMNGCKLSNCTNSTMCTVCEIIYYLKIVNTSDQNCQLCSIPIANCSICTDQNYCTTCQIGFYLSNVYTSGNITGKQCVECNTTLVQCTNCTNNLTCLNCTVGFVLNSSNQCICDISFNNLTNCQSCVIPAACDICNTRYYINLTTGRCQPCSNIHTQCINCTDQYTCNSCNLTYVLDMYIISGNTTCSLCSDVIYNCTQCSSVFTCTNCDINFGLTAINQCQPCNTLIMPGCLTCQTSALCLSCDNTTKFINNVCYYCANQIFKCLDCIVINSISLQCTECQPGYIIQPTTKQCKPCKNLIDYCFDCNSSGCLSCIYPYLLGPSGLCDQCAFGYELKNGFCLKYPGCQNVVLLNNGTQICLSCLIQYNFIFDPTQQKCICNEGFKQFYPLGSLMQCIPNCGDGILLIDYEQCDDKNFINNDGCNQFCKRQANFECSFSSPSQCILHLNLNFIIFKYAKRILGQNKGILAFQIQPRHIALENLNWDKLIKFNFSTTSVSASQLIFSYSSSTGELQVEVPYSQQLQDTWLQTNITLDPNYLVSTPTHFLITNKLNGLNAPLNFQQNSALSTQKNVNSLSFIIIIFLLLQFYVGSYFHKMIGLQTIQTIQTVYFARMLIHSKFKNLINSINSIKYSATGYQNGALIFGQYKQAQTQSYSTVASGFLSINMQKIFLLNVNFCLIPLLLILVVYIYSLVQKYLQRNKYIELREQEQKDKYTKFNRSALWVYDHFVFPYTMMFTPIVFFNTLLILQSSQAKQSGASITTIQDESFMVQMVMLFVTSAIYCYQTFYSYLQYAKYRMTSRQRSRISQSLIQKLEHDQNNPDRSNYHPFYVFIFLMYSWGLWFIIVIQMLIQEFNLSLQILCTLTIGYFIFIYIWKPYHQSINVHNHFLKINHGTVAIFLIICTTIEVSENVSYSFYIFAIYFITILLVVIMAGGFIRIILEKRFRSRLQQNSDLLKVSAESNDQQQLKSKDKDLIQNSLLQKKKLLLMNNQYSFQNQLTQLGRKYGITPLIQKKLSAKNKDTVFNPKEQQFLVHKMRKQYQKKQQNIILEQYISNQLNKDTIENEQKFEFNMQMSRKQSTNSIFGNNLNLEINSNINGDNKKDYADAQINQLKVLKRKLRREWDLMEPQQQQLKDPYQQKLQDLQQSGLVS